MFSDERANALLNEILDIVCPTFEDTTSSFQSSGRWPQGKDRPAFEVRVFPSPVELLGGKHDGATAYQGFRINLKALYLAVSKICEEITLWEFDNGSNPMDDLPRPCITIAGIFKGTDGDILMIRICPFPPEEAEVKEKHQV
ncbi:MAG: hypothetical protein BIFFINMI_03819 [Phycisphaerae bacterium]|nr:hypothetical protein [Phycisphaerae bacterium]